MQQLHTNSHRRLVCYALTALASWLTGIGAYVAALAALSREYPEWDGDLQWILIWTGIASIFVLPTVHVPVLLALRQWRGGCKPVWLFVLSAILLTFVPAAVALLFLGGCLRTLWTPLSLCLHIMFAASGFVLAIGFVLSQRCGRATSGSGFEVISRQPLSLRP